MTAQCRQQPDIKSSGGCTGSCGTSPGQGIGSPTLPGSRSWRPDAFGLSHVVGCSCIGSPCLLMPGRGRRPTPPCQQRHAVASTGALGCRLRCGHLSSPHRPDTRLCSAISRCVAALDCRRRRRRPKVGPKARTRRWINRAKRTIRCDRTTLRGHLTALHLLFVANYQVTARIAGHLISEGTDASLL
jgi:hypothetical protein